MGLFTKKEKQKLAELAAEIQEARDAHAKDIKAARFTHRAEVEELRLQVASLQSNLEDETTARVRISSEAALAKAGYEAQVELLKEKAAKWDRLSLGWTWHSGGSVEIEGMKYDLKEARTDNPLANFRLPIPDGDSL